MKVRNTLLVKFIRELTKDMDPPKDVEVEDAAYKEWLKENGNCGPSCDKNGDLDGDGVTNGEEIENGTNPTCNEQEYGDVACREVEGEDPGPTPTPGPGGNVTPKPVVDQLLLEDQASAGESFTFDVPLSMRTSNNTPDPYYDRWPINWTLSEYNGDGLFPYTIRIIDDNTGFVVFSADRTVPLQQTSDSYSEEIDSSEIPNGTYRLDIQTNNSPTADGNWYILLRGIRDGNR